MSDTQGSGVSITPGGTLTTLGDTTALGGANPSMAAQGQTGNYMNLAPGVGVDGAGSLDFDGDGEPDGFELDNPEINSSGNAPYNGNEDFERCQSYADRPWNEVVEGTQNGEDPHQYFKGSWHDLKDNAARGENITYGAEATAARNHLGVVNECAAMASVGDPNNFNREQPNQYAEISSSDGSISCRYHGAEAVDFTQCQQMINAHDALTVAEADLRERQGEEFKAAGESSVKGLQQGMNIQGNSAIVAANLADNAAKSAAEREAFQSARLDAMASELAAMPNYKSILQTCHSRMSKYPNGALSDYQAYISTIPDLQIPARPPLGDPCQRALGRLDVKYIQNKKAKDQAFKVLEKLGYKIEKLQDQQSTLHQQRQGFRDSGMKGQSIPEFEYKDLQKAKIGDYGVINLDVMSSFVPVAVGPQRGLASKSGFSNIDYNVSSKSERNKGIKQGLIHFAQKDHQQILRENTNTFISLLRIGDKKALLSFMKANGLSLADIDYAARKGVISKAQAEELKKYLQNRLGKVTSRRMVDFDPNGSNSEGNREWQIEKNKEKSLFEIITNRYLKQEQLTR